MITTQHRVALTVSALLLTGCASTGASPLVAPGTSPGGSANPSRAATSSVTTSSATTLHVTANFHLPPASAMVVTPKWLWVLGGPSGVLTQIDPATNTIVRTVHPPHTTGYGTVHDGSLWLVSFLDSVVMQLDADSGTVQRVIGSDHDKPFFRPIGVVATGGTLWVVNHADGAVKSTLVRLDDRTGHVTGTTELPGHHAGGPLLAGGQIWIALTTEGAVVRVDPGTGSLVGEPIGIDTGVCRSGSVTDGGIWFTGLDLGSDFPCRDASRRLDPITLRVSPTIYGPGQGLFGFAALGGSLWASDVGRTIYRVDVGTGVLRPTLTLPGDRASTRLLAAFGSLWALGGETGELERIDAS